MDTYRHPRAPDDVAGYPPHRVHVSRGETAAVNGDGTFEAPEAVARAIADHEGVSVDSMRVGGDPAVCDAVKADGEICGRERPCPYHD